jgi:hypothetical protein
MGLYSIEADGCLAGAAHSMPKQLLEPISKLLRHQFHLSPRRSDQYAFGPLLVGIRHVAMPRRHE